MKQQIRFCRSHGGARIAYATLGNGPPLVKAANWLSHLEFDLESPVWRHWMEKLSRDHMLIRYDQGGCGLSDWNIDDLSLETWLGELEAVIDALELEKFPLLGISQGGPIAIAYAVKHPERVSRLILYGAYARGGMKRARSEREVEEAQTLIKLVQLGWGKENPAFRQLFTTLFLPKGAPDQLEWFNELQRISTTPANASRILRQFDEIDVSGLAPRIDVPTLVLHAKGDARIPFEEGRLLAAMIPDARFVPLDSANHILLSDEPAWRRFVDEVERFLTIEPAPVVDPPRPVRLDLVDTLTRRENEILELIARGLGNPEIAAKLFISPNTLRNHITSIYSKMAVAKRAEAIVRARKAGFGR
jgi:pimeloyl-ACP methyl ester carboxylesterase/DNA-binding CsgD family transcriptional regulator